MLLLAVSDGSFISVFEMLGHYDAKSFPFEDAQAFDTALVACVAYNVPYAEIYETKIHP